MAVAGERPPVPIVCVVLKTECAGSARVILLGEIPNPAKFSEQPVPSLGAEAVWLGLSIKRWQVSPVR
jgi:hypothetical protein